MNTRRQITRWVKADFRRMAKRATWAVGVLLVGPILLAGTAGCGSADTEELVGLTEQRKTATTESYTDFRTFEYTCTPGLAFDMDPDAVSHASITREAGGDYWLELRVWEGDAGGESRYTWDELVGDVEWESADDQVDYGWDNGWSWQEPTERDLPPRALTTSEVRRMLNVFAEVPVEHEYIEDMIDYSMIEDVRWDSRSLSANAFYGYSETVSYAKMEEIVEMLGDFRAVSER